MMNQETNERISVFTDGEADDYEAEQALRSLLADPGLQQTWGRYHLIGDLMRGEGAEAAGIDISGAVSRALEAEPPIIAAPRRTHWLDHPSKRKTVGAAIAASVAALVVVWSPLSEEQDAANREFAAKRSEAPALAAVPKQAPVTAAPAVAQSAPMRWKVLGSPQLDSRLDGYLLDHSEFASEGGLAGFSPYASVVSFEPAR